MIDAEQSFESLHAFSLIKESKQITCLGLLWCEVLIWDESAQRDRDKLLLAAITAVVM